MLFEKRKIILFNQKKEMVLMRIMKNFISRYDDVSQSVTFCMIILLSFLFFSHPPDTKGDRKYCKKDDIV